MFHLLLDESTYPVFFDDLCISGASSSQKKKYFEDEFVSKITQVNNKIKEIDVLYCDIESLFPNVVNLKRIGLIVEEVKCKNSQAEILEKQDCYILKPFDHSSKIVYRIKFYVYFSSCTESSRSAFISQQVFPEVMDCASKSLASSCLYLVNHPIIFVNLVNKKITSSDILREQALLTKAGFIYIELFSHNSFDPKTVPNDAISFLKSYYLISGNMVDDLNFCVDIVQKKMTLKVDKLLPSPKGYVISKPSKAGVKLEFSGSSEKFYWMDTLFLAIFLRNKGYIIDYNRLERYLNTNCANFGRSIKITRFIGFLDYIKKISR